jgi:chorismate synthase
LAILNLKKIINELALSNIDSNMVRCPDASTAQNMIQAIENAKETGDSLGGTIVLVVKNCPVGWGEPVFDKLEAQLAKAMLSIPAVKGFEIGSGFAGSKMKGSEHNDVFEVQNGQIQTQSNLFWWHSRWHKQWHGYLLQNCFQTYRYYYAKPN